MLDKKGRLFGKVSIVDLFAIAVIVMAAVFVYGKLGVASIVSGAKGEPVVMRFRAEQAPSCVAENLHKDDTVLDVAKGVNLGRIRRFETGDSYAYYPGEDGNLVKSAADGYSFVEIETTLTAVIDSNGIIVDGNRYLVGSIMFIYAGDTYIEIQISGIDKDDSL